MADAGNWQRFRQRPRQRQ